jgi:hypothetical protein
MSYVDLVENILVEKDDIKPAAKRMKKATTDTCQDDSMDTTPIPDELLCKSSNYQSESISTD